MHYELYPFSKIVKHRLTLVSIKLILQCHRFPSPPMSLHIIFQFRGNFFEFLEQLIFVADGGERSSTIVRRCERTYIKSSLPFCANTFPFFSVIRFDMVGGDP